MARFCTECGKAIMNDVAFCTECGAAAPKEDTAPQQPEKEPVMAATAPTQPQPQTYAHATQQDAKPTGGKYGIVGTGYFFGMMFLYAIPVLGWLVCIITAFAAKNENKKHFAKAMMIWLIIGIVLSVAAYFVFRWVGGMLTDYINTEFGGQFGDLQELLEQFKQFENGGFTLPTN